MIDISVNNLIKRFEIGTNVLDGLSFNVTAGEHVAILGVNGAGKSCLFRKYCDSFFSFISVP